MMNGTYEAPTNDTAQGKICTQRSVFLCLHHTNAYVDLPWQAMDNQLTAVLQSVEHACHVMSQHY